MFKWIFFFVIFVITVHYFNIDVRSIVEYTLGLLASIWSYVKEPMYYILDIAKRAIEVI